MAGKRYDQYNIAPSEAGTTDYKRYPEVTHGKDEDMQATGDKQRLAESRKEAQGQPFPPDVPAPSVESRHGQKLDSADADAEDAAGAADSEPGKENPLA